jgi:hypothetical protein
VIGTTTVEFECSIRRWFVDLDRERQLLARDDDASWTIYADELLSRGDPLGSVLAKADEFDLAFHLDIKVLQARGQLFFIEDRGLWREITFRPAQMFDDGGYVAFDYLDVWQLQAVLTHPRAWFARRVTIEVPDDFWEYHPDFVRQLAAEVSRSAGHFLERISIPNFPEGQALPTARDGVRVDLG